MLIRARWRTKQLTLQSGVEEKAADSDQEVATEGYQKDAVMVLRQAISYSLDREDDEEQVRHSTDDFGRVDGGIVVLGYD